MPAGFGEQKRRLYDRGGGSQGLVVDPDGVLLGPDCPLVERTRTGFQAIGLPMAKRLLRDVFAYDDDPRPLVTLCRSIGKALDDGDLLRAQLLGLQMPIGKLERGHFARLRRFAPMAKAGFNRDELRANNGQWSAGGEVFSPAGRHKSQGVVIHGDGQAAFDRSVEYLSQSPLAAKVLAQAAALGVVVNIVSGNPNNDEATDKAVLENGAVHVNWNPRTALSNDSAILSPALALLHEFGHAIALIQDPDGTAARSAQPMPDYNNAEEYRVISTIENPVAADLGEPIRHRHEPRKGQAQTYVPTDDPTLQHAGPWE